MISWRMAAAWATALVVATVLTWQIVGLADSQVGETPAAVAPSLSTSSTGGSSTTSTSAAAASAGDSTSTTSPGTTRDSSAGTSTSTTPGGSSSSPPTSSSTSTTATVESWSLRTIATNGGVVVVRYRTGEVELQAATPAPGFSVEVDDAGPPRVRVEFKSDVTDARVEARWDDGALVVDVDA